jgi:hypothetical protein
MKFNLPTTLTFSLLFALTVVSATEENSNVQHAESIPANVPEENAGAQGQAAEHHEVGIRGLLVPRANCPGGVDCGAFCCRPGQNCCGNGMSSSYIGVGRRNSLSPKRLVLFGWKLVLHPCEKYSNTPTFYEFFSHYLLRTMLPR